MGMDVYGQAPKTETGKYFRNNVWWWRPLWEYCENVAPQIAGEVQNAQYNDGDGLDEDNAAALGTMLFSSIASGFAVKYEAERNARISRLPRHDCGYCDGTGTRADDVGVSMGMSTRKLDDADAILLGRTHGWCNACNGEGLAESFEAGYRFSVDNVKEFAEFLINSGGFSIC